MVSTSFHQPDSLKHVGHQQAVDNEARCVLALHCHLAHGLPPPLHGIKGGIRGLRDAHNLRDKRISLEM